MDASDNPFFRKKPSTKVHHPPGGASSLGIWLGDSANELDSKGAKEVPVDGDNYGDPKHSGGACDNSTAEANDCEADLDTENKEKNAQIDNSRECRGENSPDGTFKPVRTNVKIHNPPGGKSSFSLY